MAQQLKSIRNTFLYDSMNKGNYLNNLITDVIAKGKVLKIDDLSFEVNTINKYYKYPLKKDVMDAFREGILKPVVLPNGVNVKVPASIPFLLAGSSELIAYVFIDNYKTYDQNNNTYSIDPKKLYCLLESAYLAMIIQKNYHVIGRSTVLLTEGSLVFAHTFIRVLNKKYALNVDKRAYAKVLYLAAKYFMINVLGQDASSEAVANYALKVADVESPFIVNEVDKVFSTPDVYANIHTFINALAANAYLISRSLSELTVKDFISDYVKMYHTSSIFALEHPSYFTFMVDSVILGAYLNNQAILEDLVGKSGAKIYNAIAYYKY